VWCESAFEVITLAFGRTVCRRSVADSLWESGKSRGVLISNL